MLSNYLIGLREGLEAALIVAILVAYLVRLEQRSALPRLWAGVGAALLLSVGAAVFLQVTSQTLSDAAAETFAGIMSILAAALITWMIFWMARHAHELRGHLHGEVDRALAGGSWMLAGIAFLAVIREGLETALFLWAGIRAAGTSSSPVAGALLGLATAVVIGLLVYRGALRLNLSRLFTWTGGALVVVAAGVLSYGVHDLQEAGVLPGKDSLAFDVSGVIPPDSWLGTILRGAVNFTPATTWLQLAAWLAYIVPVLVLYVRVVRRPRGTRAARAHGSQGVATA